MSFNFPHAVGIFPTGIQAPLRPGDVLGRDQGQLGLDDPRISRAHAQIALRGGRLRILALRGPLWVDGAPHSDIVLTRGKRVVLVTGIALGVESVHLPARVPCLQVGRSHSHQPIPQSPCHILKDGSVRPGAPPEQLCLRYDANWEVRRPGDRWTSLFVDRWITYHNLEIRLSHLPIAMVGMATRTEHDPIVRIKSWEEETEVFMGDGPPIRLTRTTHTILRELRRLNLERGPVHWQEVAERVWPCNHDRQTLWHTKRSRMRREFQRLGLPHWLLRSQNGIVELQLREQDQFELLERVP